MIELCERILQDQNLASQALTWRRAEILGLVFESRNPELLALFGVTGFSITEEAEKDLLYSFFKHCFHLNSLIYLGDLRSTKASKELKDAISGDLSAIERGVPKVQSAISEVISGDLPSEKFSIPTALKMISKGVSLIREAVNSEDREVQKRGTEEFQKGIEALVDDLIYLVWQRGTTGSSKDRYLNLLINVTHGAENGACSENFFQIVWMVFAEYFRWSSRNFRRLLKIVKHSSELDGSLEKEAYRYEEAKKAFETIKSMVLQKSYSGMEKPLKVLGKFYDWYDEVRQRVSRAYQKLHGQTSKKCPRCGFTNSIEAWACQSCKLTFPEVASFSPLVSEMTMSKEFLDIPFLEVLANAVEDVKDHELGEEEFRSVLDWVDQIVDTLSKDFSGMVELFNPPENTGAKAGKVQQQVEKVVEEKDEEAWPIPTLSGPEELLGKYKGGIELLAEGVTLLRTWTDTKSDKELEKGLRLATQGAEKLRDYFTPKPLTQDTSQVRAEEADETTLGIG